MPDTYLYDHNHLAAEMFEFLTLRSGRPFTGKSSSRIGWSQVVWDLLELSVAKAFNRKQSGFNQSPRAIGDVDGFDGLSFAQATSSLAFSTISEIIGPKAGMMFSSNESPADDLAWREDNTHTECGVSLLLLETSAKETNEEKLY
jgi:hypothetical protein